MEPDGDLYGDGVNVAARLEPLAEPGGVWVSRSVYDLVRDKVRYPFEYRGKIALKNIARPVGVYALSASAVIGLANDDEAPEAATGAIGRPWRAIAATSGSWPFSQSAGLAGHFG